MTGCKSEIMSNYLPISFSTPSVGQWAGILCGMLLWGAVQAAKWLNDGIRSVARRAASGRKPAIGFHPWLDLLSVVLKMCAGAYMS